MKNLKLAPGATVEVKTGASYQKKIYEGVPLLFGLAGYKEVDTVRITWPNGLIQNEPKQPVLTALNFKEAQRLSGSCPMIFTWNGKQFEFITDVLGVAPLGASSGDGQYFPVDHDEYVQIPGESLVERDGDYEIRITEELREVSYLDQVQLIAVDHPAGTEIFTNEKFKSPPFPEFRLFGVEPADLSGGGARSAGRDVLARLLKRDRTYPDSFHRDYAGVAELHHLDLDFGNAARDGRAVLILNGWVDWADGSTFLRASQESKNGLVLPYLQVKNAQGEWQTVIEDMGIPAGKPKTIAVDLTGKWLSPSREVRIVTNLCVYWDEIFLSDNSTAPDSATHARECRFGRPAFPRLLETNDRSGSASSRKRSTTRAGCRSRCGIRRRACTRATATCGRFSRPWTIAWSSWDRATSCGCCFPRAICRPSSRDGSAIFCCWWTAGPRTATTTRRSRNR